jgi:hypothetical protein
MSGSMAGTPSIPRQSRPTGTVRSFANSTCRVSPRRKRSSGASSIQTGVSGPPERRFTAPRRALMDAVGRPCAWPSAGSSMPSEAAPNPAISSRRSNRKFRLVMRPIRTIFRVRCPVAAVWPNAAGTGHFFAANARPHAISRRPRHRRRTYDALHAGVAELVDALDLGSSDESCGGSSPSARTKRFQAFARRFLEDLFPRGILVRQATGTGRKAGRRTF